MRYLVLSALLLLLPVNAWAQPAPQSGPDQFLAWLTTNLNKALTDNDQLRAKVADLQKQLDDSKKAAPDAAAKQ